MAIVVFGHEKGGVGKSSLACSFACRSMHMKGARVVLVDTDRQSSSANWGAIRNANEAKPHVQIVQVQSGINSIVLNLKKDYKIVVVDIGANDYDKLQELAKIADLWIAPTRVAQPDLASTVRLFDAFDGAKHIHYKHKIPLGVLVNSVPGPWNATEDKDAKEWLKRIRPDIHLFDSTLRDRRVWRDTVKLGRGITELNDPKANAEFEAFYAEAVEYMKKMAR